MLPMHKIQHPILVLAILFALLEVNTVFASTRIFYEDCEDAAFTEHFLERYYGTGYQSYWLEFISEVSRSTENPYNGQYCMTYDPWTTGNPHAVVGYGGANYGNTSNYDLSSYNQRHWFFRWYQRWETGISWSGSAQNKLLYINYSDTGDFVFVLARNGSPNFHITIKDRDTGSLVVNDWLTNPGGNLDDMQWHKIEVLIDVGTTGQSNGSYVFKVDDALVNEHTEIQYNGTIHSNPVHHLTGWPSNTSGTLTGTCNTWLDDLEIWDGIPDTTGITENSDVGEASQSPCTVSLTASPNPFAGSLSLTIIGDVDLENTIISVYDLSGHLIRVLNPCSGASVSWNRCGADGIECPAGTYIAVIRSGECYGSCNLVLIR